MAEPAAGDGLRISTDAADVDLDVVHGFLSTGAYWSPGVPRAMVARAVANSLCFSAWLDGRQVGFARVVTDYASFGYLADVFVLPEVRGRGISKRLIDAVMAHPRLQSLRRFLLATADAHSLYTRYGFAPLTKPERFLEVYRPDAYLNADADAD